jgi:cytoskeletal protein RodZ
MDRTLTYALLGGVALVIIAVIVKAALRWALKIFALLIVIAALAVGAWLWFNHSNRQLQHDRTATPTRRTTPAQH